MAVKFTKRDDLDKMFEEFAKLPDLKQVTFPDDKEKKVKAEKSQSRKEKLDDCFSTTPI
ncbi:putative type II restriction endonuclease DpnI [Streptococcus pneumoniae]|nr:putative type II restriction endonuclease DpnI [Streptococcus pneumoniae]VQW57665.1 putative type II restriction endonuclease DpnI [Streptococcus pneumoniae]VRB39602.1 putative type II restriction endonuclease DpnI [Streptococcus pneumoniae]